MKDEEKAEEIANKRCHEIMCYGHCSFSSPKHHRCGEWHREYNCALAGLKAGRPQWHKIFESEPSCVEYWDLPQDRLPKIENFYFVKLKNGYIKICELKYDHWSGKKFFYDFHGGKQSNVAEWARLPPLLVRSLYEIKVCLH